MKKLLFILAFLIVFNSLRAQSIPEGVSSTTNIFLIRHAEKAIDGTNNPPLTAAGKKRAGDLMRHLQNKKIKRIYVTQYQRTQMTADSMRIQLGIDTVHYTAGENGVDLFNKITAHNDFGEAILIIGHNNSIPKNIKKLGVANYPTAVIPETEFNNIYNVYYKQPFIFFPFKAYVKSGKYGAP